MSINSDEFILTVMTETRSPSEVAAAIAEGVRSLNYQTRAGAAQLEYPSDLYDVVGELRTAAQRLPQLFGQMAAWLTVEHDAGRVAHANGADTGEYVRAVADALGRASEDAATLTAALESAHDASSYLTGETPPAIPECPECGQGAPHIAQTDDEGRRWQCTECGDEWSTP